MKKLSIILDSIDPCQTEESAIECVDNMSHESKDGYLFTGNYWPLDQIDDLCPGKVFPPDITRITKYIICNYCWHLLGNYMDDDEEILNVAYGFIIAAGVIRKGIQK